MVPALRSFLVVCALLISGTALAEKGYGEIANRLAGAITIWGAPLLVLGGSYPLVRSGFDSTYKPNPLTRTSIVGLQTAVFGSLGYWTAYGLYGFNPYFSAAISIASATGGYYLANAAFEHNKAASMTSVVIPLAPVAYILIMAFSSGKYR